MRRPYKSADTPVGRAAGSRWTTTSPPRTKPRPIHGEWQCHWWDLAFMAPSRWGNHMYLAAPLVDDVKPALGIGDPVRLTDDVTQFEVRCRITSTSLRNICNVVMPSNDIVAVVRVGDSRSHREEIFRRDRELIDKSDRLELKAVGKHLCRAVHHMKPWVDNAAVSDPSRYAASI